MLKNLFKTKKELEVKAPLEGKVIPLAEVPDPVFAEKMMGDGLAIIPAGGKVVSPVDGELVQIFPTKHALGFRTRQGVELLLHIGLDTVMMKGEGFRVYVEEGTKVEAGQLLLEFSLELVEEKAKSPITPLVITNGEAVEELELHLAEQAIPGETVLMNVRGK
ncbi:PTS sugar transporter subunit IIA [Siminovitchia fortis]|uniref:PTS glucose transporter subunit IIA n=1 Tax=Siminovitchia fortis TaxID=254758 RepID=A0A443J0L1_9BACI|nr:PTS glucose transporter subunit IIA [Siminovitchia fortis]RWR13926.1 PTS glucose transporter subunit IIA [Siminovitchia fortis]WHY81226.1 PTS glucose transporter subunit IIA [Siminovitchia fortis]